MISGPLPPKPRWGIVGPGEIARVFVRALEKYDLGSIEAVYGRCSDRRGAFCREFGGRPMETLEGLLQPGVVNVVYVATPHAAHSEAVEGALERGIAVLCEKPMTVDPAETSRLIDLAQDNPRFWWKVGCTAFILRLKRWSRLEGPDNRRSASGCGLV